MKLESKLLLMMDTLQAYFLFDLIRSDVFSLVVSSLARSSLAMFWC